MTREEKRRRTILRAIAALAADEEGELAKLRRLRTVLYCCGAVLLGVTLVVNVLARWLVWRVARQARA